MVYYNNESHWVEIFVVYVWVKFRVIYTVHAKFLWVVNFENSAFSLNCEKQQSVAMIANEEIIFPEKQN